MATSQRFPFFSFHEQVQSRASNQQQQQQQQEQTPAMASMGFPPVPMNIDLDPIFVRLPTGEQVPNQLFWGPYPLYRPWHYCAQHWNYLNYWYHSFGIHYAQGQSSSLWQTIHSRLGYVAAHDRAFDMVHNIDDSWDSWALDAPLSRGLRFLESLDLCCHTQGLVQLNNYFISTPYNPFGQAYRRIKPVQEYLEISTNYETTFDIKQGEDSVEINLVPLSPASKYHIDILLRYDEVRDSNQGYRGRYFKLNRDYVSQTGRSFTLFPKLPAEIRAHVVRAVTGTQPHRILLRLSAQKGNTGTSFRSLEPRTIPSILQVNKDLRAKGSPLHNFVEMKHNPTDARGLICLPDVDMIFISKKDAAGLNPQAFNESLLASNCLHKLKSIAVSATHPHFWAFIQDFKNYASLELVFIVVSEAEHDARVRKWGLDNGQDDFIDSRLSCKKEILFEVLHPSNVWAGSDAIPGVKTKNSRPATYREPEVIEQLVVEMARGQGKERVAPNIRFVRLVKCQKTQEDIAREYDAFYAR